MASIQDMTFLIKILIGFWIFLSKELASLEPQQDWKFYPYGSSCQY